MLSDRQVTAQLVDHQRPGSLGILQPMNHQHDGFARIIRLEPLNGSSVCIFLRVQETGELVLFRIALLEHHGERHSKVGCQRNRAPIEGHRFSGERIFEREDTAASLKMRYDGYAVKDPGGRKVRPSVFRLWFDGDDRRSDAKARYPLGHIFSADIKLVGWGKFIQRGVPLGPRIGFVREREIASRARNRYRRAPWIKFRVMNDLENARDPKVVIANSGRVS